MYDDLIRQALSVAISTSPPRRQQLFSLLPKGTFKGPEIYFNLGRFFATDTSTERLEDIAKATKLDVVALAEIMVEDVSLLPLSKHLTRLLAERQTVAQTSGQDVTEWAVAITRINEAKTPAADGAVPEQKPFFMSVASILEQAVEIKPLLGKVIERDSTGQIFGPSSGGKTFVALDMAMAVGAGGQWNGNKCEQGAVVYFAGEGHAGLSRRVKAWHKCNPGSDLSNVHISRTAISFTIDCLRAAVEEIKALEKATGKQLALIVIDTLARHIEGDENSTKDMGGFVRTVDGLRCGFPGSSAIIVHHSGNNAEHSHRSRGSSALKGACDFEIQCDKGLLTYIKVKDGELPPPVEFKLVPVEIGQDAKNDPITSCVVLYGEKSSRHQTVSFTKMEKTAITALISVSAGKLQTQVGGKVGALIGDWRDAFYVARLNLDPDTAKPAMKKAFERAVDALVAKGIVAEDGPTRILVSEEHQAEIMTAMSFRNLLESSPEEQRHFRDNVPFCPSDGDRGHWTNPL